MRQIHGMPFGACMAVPMKISTQWIEHISCVLQLDPVQYPSTCFVTILIGVFNLVPMSFVL